MIVRQRQKRKIVSKGLAALGLAVISFLGLTVAMPAHTYAAVTNPQPVAKVSFTFDDGYTGAVTKAAPALAEYGMSGTEYVITGMVGQPEYMTWPQITTLQNQYGWEIGSHTVTHPELTTVTAAKLETEMAASKSALQSRGFAATSFAAPYGDYNNQVLAAAAKHYAIHRPFWDTEGTNVWPYSDYLLQVKQVQSGVTVDQVKGYINEAKQKKLWLVLVFHEIKDVPSADPQEYEYSTANLKKIAAYVKSQGIATTNVSKGTVTSTTNMLANATFDNGLSNGWTTDNATQVKKNTASKGSQPSPTSSIEMNATTTAKSVHLFAPKVDVLSSTTYMIKSFLNVEKLTSGEVTYYIDEYDASGNWISGQYKSSEATSFVEAMNFTYKPTSVNVKKASLQIAVSGNSGIKAFVDNVQWFALN